MKFYFEQTKEKKIQKVFNFRMNPFAKHPLNEVDNNKYALEYLSDTPFM